MHSADFLDGYDNGASRRRPSWAGTEDGSSSSRRLLDSPRLSPRPGRLEPYLQADEATPERNLGDSQNQSGRSTRFKSAMDTFKNRLEAWGADRNALPMPVQQNSPSIAANITSMRRRQISRQHANLKDYIGYSSPMARNVSAASEVSQASDASTSAPSSLGWSSKGPSRRSSFSSVDEDWHKQESYRGPAYGTRAHFEDRAKETWLYATNYWTATNQGRGPSSMARKIWSVALLAFVFFVGSLLIGIEAGIQTQDRMANIGEIESRETIASGRTKIIFYRILGNDLPPRHKPGQTLTNLKFLLENEADFENTEKWFILNRIADPQNEAALIAMLDAYHAHYFRIPFVSEEYSAIDFRLDIFPTPDFFSSYEFANMTDTTKLRALDSAYASKNIYAMNNNGGRNAALEHGKSRAGARWILPFDGNSFFTQPAFHDLIKNLNATGSTNPYYIVPMARLLDNNQVIGDDANRSKPAAKEEPQIAFRWDAQMQFDSRMRYGRRSKLEMLWRLGYAKPHKIAKRHVMPWERGEGWDAIMQQTSRAAVGTAGWVFRLFSGEADQETSPELRAHNRLLAIQRFIDGLDERASLERGFNRNTHIKWQTLEEARLEANALNGSVCEQTNLICAMRSVIINAIGGHIEGDAAASLRAANLFRQEILDRYLDADGSPKLKLSLSTPQSGLEFPSWRAENSSTIGAPFVVEDGEEAEIFALVPSFVEAIKILKNGNDLSDRDESRLEILASSWLTFLLRDPTSTNPMHDMFSKYSSTLSARRDAAIIALAAYLNDLKTLVRVSTRTRMRITEDLERREQDILPALEIDLEILKMLERAGTLPRLAIVHLRAAALENLSTLQREAQWTQP